ncbi:Hypothetical predicted protein [Prunus dulcis]|uniref:Uncharacterized protein n=1 Tax=Prunus dulcis TaxID=3755 RepID=A0A5E4GB92_PRUDU|nr:Hypothetical predicted protein [Prunus dulcis]
MGRSFSLKQPLARPFHKPSLSQLPFSSLQHHLHCAVFVTKLAIHVTDLGIEFIEVVISLASRSLKSPSSRGHLHDLLNLLHRVCQEPPSLLSSRLRLLFLSSSTYSSLNLRFRFGLYLTFAWVISEICKRRLLVVVTGWMLVV